MDQWKGWLKEHYQYDLSPTRWSKLKLISAKWRKSVKKHNMFQNKTYKSNFYEKNQLIHSKKQKDSEVYLLLLLNEKNNFQKNSKYDLLSYEYINSENRGNSFFYESPFERKRNMNREFFSTSNTHKDNPFNRLDNRLENTLINHYRGKGGIRYRKNYYDYDNDRKFLNWKILNFDLRKNPDMDIELWVKSNTRSNQNTKIDSNHQLSNNKKNGLFYRTLLKKPNTKRKSQSPQKPFLDWMGMNEEILNRPGLGLKFWFFPEFLLLYNLYKSEPWVIRSKLFICNLNLNENIDENVVSEKKNITGKEKGKFISSNKNTKNKKVNQKEPAAGRNDLGSDAQKSQGAVGPFLYKKKQYKSKTEAELDLFLKRYFLFQLRWGDALNQRILTNIKIYCLLLRLKNPRNITLSSIQRREMCLDLMLIEKNLSLSEVMERGVLVIEPTRLSVKHDGKFLMYKTLGISLVHTHKEQTNQRYREEDCVDTNNFNLPVPENILSPRRRRDFRILICFNQKTKNRNLVDIPSLCWTKNNWKQLLDKEKDRDKDKNELINLKLFLWPNYRLEDLACLNRYWFDTTNGSRFSILRIHMYPSAKGN